MADLLARRVRLAQRVALVKHVTRAEPRDVRREEEVRRRYEDRLLPAGWSADALDTWMRTLIEVSVQCQSDVPVAYQGAPGCWSQRTLAQRLPMARGVGYETFEDAWRAVENGDAAAAWLPVANSLLGPFQELESLLAGAHTLYESREAVHHVMAGHAGQDVSAVSCVYGHPKALEQCRRRLAEVAPAAELVPVDDAGSHARDHPLAAGAAVLGSPALVDNGLVVLLPDACDASDNTTTFRLLAATASM